MNHKINFKFGVLLLMLFAGITGVKAQDNVEKLKKESQTFVKKAEKAKKDGNFAEAEADYRRAMGKNYNNAEAHYNLGHLYGDKDMDADGMSQLFKAVKNTKDRSLRHKAYHNMGNAFMKQEDYAQAVNAYKDALRNDPTDDETRYNLAIAKKKLEENPDQGGDDNDDSDDQDQNDDSQDNQSQDQDQDQQDQDDNDDGEGGDQDEDNQNQDKEDGDEDEDDQSGQGDQDEDEDEGDQDDKDQDQNGDDQDNSDDNQDEKQGNQTPQGISDEQAENLLKAAENLEKGVQEKLDAKKGEEIKGKPNRKNW